MHIWLQCSAASITFYLMKLQNKYTPVMFNIVSRKNQQINDGKHE